MKKTWTYALAGGMLLALLAAGGCTRQSLDYRKAEGYVTVALQWEEGYAPAGSRFYFYPEAGGEPLTYDCPPEGFRGQLPEGSYKMIVHNSDLRNVALRNEQRHETAELYVLPETEARSRPTRSECISQPDNIYLAAGFDQGEKLDVSNRDTVEVSATPRSYVKRIRFRFEIKNCGPIASLEGTLSGISSSMFCATGQCSQDAQSVNFAASPLGEGNDYTAEITILELISDTGHNGTHLLELDLLETGGTTRKIDIDLTETINRILDQSGGVIPVEIPLHIALTLIGNTLNASILPWNGGGTGGGETIKKRIKRPIC